MLGPCVRVDPTAGEETRQTLADDDLIDDNREITVEEGWLYVPVTDPDAVPGCFDVVDHDVPEREPQTMPADLLSFEPSYERLGDVVLLDEDDPDRAREIADAVLDSDLPVSGVLDRASKVKGQERVRDWDVLAGDGTEVTHREYGHEFVVDLAQAFFSPRLATERHRVTEQVMPGERVVDMFAGVGPFAVPMAARGAEVVAVDVNDRAIDALRENAARNDVADRITAIRGDVRDTVGDYANWADRIVMNLPHSADEFLDTAVALAGEEAVVHFYDMAHEDDPYGPGERAIRAAAAPDYDVTVETRHTVRSYAPHELNVVLDVRLVRK